MALTMGIVRDGSGLLSAGRRLGKIGLGKRVYGKRLIPLVRVHLDIVSVAGGCSRGNSLILLALFSLGQQAHARRDTPMLNSLKHRGKPSWDMSSERFCLERS